MADSGDAYAQNGKLRWQWQFEWVIVPMTGLSLAVYGALGGPAFREAFIPVIVGMIAFPFARQVDKLRQKKD